MCTLKTASRVIHITQKLTSYFYIRTEFVDSIWVEHPKVPESLTQTTDASRSVMASLSCSSLSRSYQAMAGHITVHPSTFKLEIQGIESGTFCTSRMLPPPLHIIKLLATDSDHRPLIWPTAIYETGRISPGEHKVKLSKVNPSSEGVIEKFAWFGL